MQYLFKPSCDHFWCHIEDSALGAVNEIIGAIEDLADTKVTQDEITFLIEHHVLWFDVSVSNVRYFVAIVQSGN